MIADVLLIYLPLRTLRELKNQPRLRRRLQFIFAASALATCASAVSSALNLSHLTFGYLIAVDVEVHHDLSFLSFPSPFPFASTHFQFGCAVLLTSPFRLSQIQNWVTLTVCNFPVLATAFFKSFSATPDRQGTIYSASGRRLGVRPQQSLTHHDDNNGEERSGDTELSKLTIESQVGSDAPTTSMTMENPSSPQPTTFEGQT
jgi:hypothetical protein